MNKIKNVFYLYKLDWKRIFSNPISAFLIIALMILPSLYAWFNIKALWDPYGNTSELPIAVYSADKGAEFQGKELSIGNEVIDSLHENKQLGWHFLDSKKELVEGVKSGKYYAGIYLPADFSKDLVSFTSGTIVKPKIEYYSNQKINAIAPKITDKGASSLQEQISKNFIETASSTLVKVFNEIGYDIDSNLVSINKVKNMILETDGNLDTIDSYTKQIVDLHDKFPEIKDKIAKAEEFTDYIPQVDEMGDKLIALNDKLPELKKQASVILTLQKKIPEIQNAGKQLKMIDDDFDSIASTMTDGIDTAKQGLQIIDQVQTALPEIQQLGDQATDIASATKEGAQQLQDALPSISNSVQVTIDSISQVATTTVSLTNTIKQAIADNQLTDQERENIQKVISDFQQNIQRQQAALDGLITFLTNLQNSGNTSDLSGIINQLRDAKSLLGDLSSRLDHLSELVKNGNTDAITDYLTEVNTAAQNVTDLLKGINVTNITDTIDNVLSKLITTITTAQDVLKKAQAIDFKSLLTSTKNVVSNAISILEKYQKELPAIKQELHDANTMLNGHMDEIVAAINKGADLYNNELPIVEDKLGIAAGFLQNDWPTIKAEITSTMNMVDEKLPDVEKALNAAVDLINNDWPNIKTGIHKAANAIRKGESEVDLGEIIKLLKLDATKEADFFKQPVELQTNDIYPIANNGSASTPFYTALCLWVGALLLSSVATTEYHLEKKDKKRFTQRETFVARMLTFLTMAIAQSLIVTLGNMFLLGVDVHNPVYSVLFALLVGLAFMMIVYVLAGLFGNVGKGIAIIILVLSISGGGGNYPIQVSGKFFQFINPLLPFTHAVNLLRESAGGIYWPNAIPQLIILSLLFIVFGIIGTWAYPYLTDVTKKLNNVSKKSHFFH
ncbi:YhgE/Pip domain-containing protein [Enterococcus gallinarum]|uniref:YhgE/Pip domain-containing protein n=1 Tax=Enterococcus gallinarum TaxID=1353 RepID=A0ABD4HJQ0_ENTGA|nr:YhgE/Pip domain-containing protein [Enterococcus gallinarum]MBA0947368.1 YhgE/Pip domain-containing protein [Enterococcus gallinarum]MBA0961397.1 YhgE/Pip domain-containing protein [Enterococcus gallinarum]MBA0968461.1 YhgE/Pip domain-containing protein [Enterococcus gallinarum]MBA0971692.1 YhgE/Pip domain-containing protein [Enterococcus gallinarum]MCR1932362.1 YhgE/Pip domain-containing protein [Enterococcus gallinarum]